MNEPPTVAAAPILFDQGDAIASFASGSESSRHVPRNLLTQISRAGSNATALGAVSQMLRQWAEPLAVIYFERRTDGLLNDGQCLYANDSEERLRRYSTQLRAAAEAACKCHNLLTRNQAAPPRLILASPVFLADAPANALAAIYSSTRGSEPLALLMQLASSQLEMRLAVEASETIEQEACDAAALLDLVAKVQSAADLRHATYELANELCEHFQSHRVAVGLQRSNKSRCRLYALSDTAQFDLKSQSARAFEAAMDEAAIQDDVTSWPPVSANEHRAALAHKHLCQRENANSAISTPLRDHSGNVVGSVLVLRNESSAQPARIAALLRTGERPLANALSANRRLDGNYVTRRLRGIRQYATSWKIALSVMSLAALLGAVAIPLPHTIRCDCKLEPITSRFVAAPFEGRLEQSFAKPGDVVLPDDLLARMDGREIRWKRAAAVADRNQAAKKRDSAMAAHQYAEAQIAKLEMERLDLELQLLDYRAENLDIVSPVAGIVNSGNLERAEGAPMVLGQTLFEIAPLEQMIVEVHVSDEDVSYVREKQEVMVRLDAFPDRTWQVPLSRIQPRSEIREQDNVFVAEALIDNANGALRPGMKGRAKVVSDRRRLGWILFHKPWEHVVKSLRW